jgi:hypothetical protein
LRIKKYGLVVNKIGRQNHALEKEISDFGADFTELIPEDKDILDLSIKGEPLTKLNFNSAAFKAIDKLGGELWQ